MQRIGIVSTAALSLLLGIAIPAYAQEEKHDQQEEKKDQPAKPAKAEEKRAPEAKPAQQQEEKRSQEAKPAQQEEKRVQEAKPAQEKSAQQQGQHNQPAQRAGGGRIPDDRFKANFGREHSFRVSENDYRNRRFQYGGYWFGFGGVWPSNWLYSQDVFVVEIDGVYYLCNANYPGVNIELNITM